MSCHSQLTTFIQQIQVGLHGRALLHRSIVARCVGTGDCFTGPEHDTKRVRPISLTQSVSETTQHRIDPRRYSQPIVPVVLTGIIFVRKRHPFGVGVWIAWACSTDLTQSLPEVIVRRVDIGHLASSVIDELRLTLFRDDFLPNMRDGRD